MWHLYERLSRNRRCISSSRFFWRWWCFCLWRGCGCGWILKVGGYEVLGSASEDSNALVRAWIWILFLQRGPSIHVFPRVYDRVIVDDIHLWTYKWGFGGLGCSELVLWRSSQCQRYCAGVYCSSNGMWRFEFREGSRTTERRSPFIFTVHTHRVMGIAWSFWVAKARGACRSNRRASKNSKVGVYSRILYR